MFTPRIIKKTVIFTDYNCNNNCVFCIDAEKRDIPGRTTEEIQKEMIDAKERGSTYLEMIGGEPTSRKDIVFLLAFASSLGFKTITMATNGRMSSYPGYVKKMVDAGLTSIIFSIHGHTPKLHDSLTQADGSFKQLARGLENFKKLGFKGLCSNTTIVKQNYKYLPDIGKFIYKQGISNSEFIFVDPSYGGANINFDKLVPRISDIAPYARECLNFGKEIEAPHWHIRYVPLCYFKEYLEQISELDEVRKFKSEHIAPDFQNFNVEDSRAAIGRVKTERCKPCSLYDTCEGIWKEYVKRYGDEELIPIITQ